MPLDPALWTPFAAGDHPHALRESTKRLSESRAFDALHIAGLSLTALDKIIEGHDWLCASLSLPTHVPAEWFCNAAIAMMDKKQFPFAEMYLKHGLEKYPNDLRCNQIYGLTKVQQYKWAEAAEVFNRILTKDPEFYHARLSLGYCYHMMQHYNEALAEYTAIKHAEPNDMEEVVNNIACLHLEEMRPHVALALLQEKYPDSERPATLYNKAIIMLGLGMWPEAWRLYQHREEAKANGIQTMPKVPLPRPENLDQIKGKRLLMFHEQGLGDTLMFGRYAQVLGGLVSGLQLGVPGPLKRLFETMLIPNCNVQVITEDSEIDADYALPMLDAPWLVQQRTDNIPSRVPYFHVSTKMLCQHELHRSVPGRLLVGLCWAGASRKDNMRAYQIDLRRSVPFELFASQIIDPFADKFDFVSLQLPAQHREHPKLAQVLEDGFDMLDTAAIIAQCDLVITVDTSVLHVAGALGVPTWMLARYDTCWRWFWDGSTRSPWYPKMRIYNPPGHKQWRVVLEEVQADLRDHLHAEIPFTKQEA